MANGYEDIDRLTAKQDEMLNNSLQQQKDIINQQTEMNIADLQKNKEDIDKDANKTNKALYTEYQKASNPYGANSENLASKGLGNSGYAESTQTNLYNTYQKNVTDTLNNARELKANFDNEINKARQSGNLQIAQSALDIYKQRLQLLSQEYDLRNNREQFLYQQSRDNVADNQWQQQFDYNKSVDDRNYNYQVGRDKVADNQWQQQFDYTKSVDDRNYKYQVGRDKVTDNQWNKQFNYNKSIDDRNYNYQVGRDRVSDSQWQKEYELSKKASASSSSRRSGGSSRRYTNGSNVPINLSDGNNSTAPSATDIAINEPYQKAKDFYIMKLADGSYATLNVNANKSKEEQEKEIETWKNNVINGIKRY